MTLLALFLTCTQSAPKEHRNCTWIAPKVTPKCAESESKIKIQLPFKCECLIEKFFRKCFTVAFLHDVIKGKQLVFTAVWLKAWKNRKMVSIPRILGCKWNAQPRLFLSSRQVRPLASHLHHKRWPFRWLSQGLRLQSAYRPNKEIK